MQNKFFIFVLALLIVLSAVTVSFCCEKNYKVVHENGLYIVKININHATIKPYVANNLETLDNIVKKTNPLVAINTGFFDAKSKKTVSYITSDGEILANPTENSNLTSNENLQPYLDRIYNRAELRILKCNGKLTVDIAQHNEPILNGCTLVSSTQAGPIILPQMKLEDEFFILTKNGKVVRDGACMTRRTDRSFAAIKGNMLYFMITDKDNPLTIYELQNKIKPYNFDKAIGFDGGGSVSLFVKQNDKDFYDTREKNNTSRPIKSALLVY